jgi:hypothetical protein
MVKKNTDHSSNTIVIGDRNTGKTTYLRHLSIFSTNKAITPSNKRTKVVAHNDFHTETLKIQARNSFRSNISTGMSSDITVAEETYTFTLEIPDFRGEIVQHVYLTSKDYPGEILRQIADSTHPGRKYLEECLASPDYNFLLLVSDIEPEQDAYYASLIDEFMTIAKIVPNKLDQLRLAVAMSKCERGELWTGRIDPETDIFEKHLKQTTNVLKSYIKRENLEFFAISTFGICEDSVPNRLDTITAEATPIEKEKRESVLRDPNEWQPFGMIGPLYWLATTKRLNSSD